MNDLYHFVLWSSLEWRNVVTVCNTAKCYVMWQSATCLDLAVIVWVGNLVVPILGLIKKEERSVVLLCRHKLRKVLKVTAVCVLSLRTLLFHTECVWADRNIQERSDVCGRCRVHGTLIWCQWAMRKLNCRSHRSGRQREGHCCRNFAGFKSSRSVSLCGTSFLNIGFRGLGTIYWGLI